MTQTIDDQIKKHQKLVYFAIKKYHPNKIGDQDIYQEGLIALWNAITSYKENKKTTFSTYATKLICNAINTAIRKEMAESRKGNLNSSKVYIVEAYADGETKDIVDSIQDTSLNIPCFDINEFCTTLNKREICVLTGKYEGLTNIEIAKQLGLSRETIRRTWNKIKERIINECY